MITTIGSNSNVAYFREGVAGGLKSHTDAINSLAKPSFFIKCCDALQEALAGIWTALTPMQFFRGEIENTYSSTYYFLRSPASLIDRGLQTLIRTSSWAACTIKDLLLAPPKASAFLCRHYKFILGFSLAFFAFYRTFRFLTTWSLGRYKNINLNAGVSPTLRPFSQRVIDPVTGAPDHPFAYAPSRQDEAADLIEEHESILDEVNSLHLGQCRECKHSFVSCTCATFQDDMRCQVRELARRDRKVRRKLVRLDEMDPSPAFIVGDSLSFSLCEYSSIANSLSYVGADLKVCFRVNQRATVGDTRPNGERHIRCGNTVFYGLELEEPILDTPLGVFRPPFFVNRALGLPMRDSFVSEDLIRYTRRGTLSGESAKSIKGALENSLSVPVNDPVFVKNNIPVIKDSFTICYAAATGCYPPENILN